MIHRLEEQLPARPFTDEWPITETIPKEERGIREHPMVIFESEEAARQVLEQGERPPADVATIESVEVGEVLAHA